MDRWIEREREREIGILYLFLDLQYLTHESQTYCFQTIYCLRLCLHCDTNPIQHLQDNLYLLQIKWIFALTHWLHNFASVHSACFNPRFHVLIDSSILWFGGWSLLSFLAALQLILGWSLVSNEPPGVDVIAAEIYKFVGNVLVFSEAMASICFDLEERKHFRILQSLVFFKVKRREKITVAITSDTFTLYCWKDSSLYPSQ